MNLSVNPAGGDELQTSDGGVGQATGVSTTLAKAGRGHVTLPVDSRKTPGPAEAQQSEAFWPLEQSNCPRPSTQV